METKEAKLNTFLKKVGAAPKQRTKEWYEGRKTTLGGSEIATVIGHNPFGNVRELIAKKIGLSSFNGNSYTRWGNLFEKLTRNWCELIMDIPGRIQETGAVEGKIKSLKYSPDGIGIVLFEQDDGSKIPYIVLFEFKAPFSSLPNGKIPPYYLPQILTGLLTINICDFGIFVNNSYRKCKLSQLGWNGEYDTVYHASDYKKRKYGQSKEPVKGCGMIFFSQKPEQYYKIYELYQGDSDSEYDINDALDDVKSTEEIFPQNEFEESDLAIIGSENSMLDFGGYDKEHFDRVLELFDKKMLQPVYFPIIPNTTAINNMDFVSDYGFECKEKKINIKKRTTAYIKRFKQRCKERGLLTVGYLPYKIYRSDIILEEPDEKWETTIKEPVEKTIGLLKKINESSNSEETFYEEFAPYEKDNMPILNVDKTKSLFTDNASESDSEISDD